MTANQVPIMPFKDNSFFKSSWEEFDRRREEMDKRSREFMEQGEREFREMTARGFGQPSLDRSSHQREEFSKKEKRSYTDNKSTRASSPDRSFFDRPPSRNRKVGFMDEDAGCLRRREDGRQLEVSLDTSQYKPDELKVTVAGGVIIVEGCHEERSQAGEVMVSRKFERKFSLPAGARPEDVESNLSSEGILVVTAKKSLPSIQVKINKGWTD